MKVLILEDDTNLKIMLQEFLASLKLESICITEGEKALSEIRETRSGIVIVDYENELRAIHKKSRESQKKLEKMNLQLELTYKKLMETAHLAGMAEVAAEVLHNVGNLLNSINVSAEIARQKITKSEIQNLQKLAVMLEANSGNLAEYLTNDAHGKHIPAYLSKAVEQIVKDKNDVLENIESLIENTAAIQNTINTQQLYTSKKNNKDFADLTDIIENAITINRAGLERYNIDVIREYEDFGKILIDKQRILQILVTIIDNAQQAMAEIMNPNRTLKIRTSKIGNRKIKIEITDNGIGIKPVNISKLFDNGFTTKPNGHGFGLHSSLMSAKNMQGTITATSAGENLGATFTIELPLTKFEVKNEQRK